MANPDVNPCHFEFMPKHSDFTHLNNPAIKNDEFSEAAEDLKEWIAIAEKRDQELEDHLNSRPCECKYSVFYPSASLTSYVDDFSSPVILNSTEIGWTGVTVDGAGNVTINEAGDYEVGASAEWQQSGDGGQRGILVRANGFTINGDTRTMGSSTTIRHIQSCSPRPVALAVGTVLTMAAYQNSGGPLNLFGADYHAKGSTYLWAHKLCQNGNPLSGGA